MITPSVTHIADGFEDTFTVPFPYLHKSHVKVYLNDVLQVADYSWLTAGSIQITSGVPAGGTEVRFERQTPTDPLVNFTPSAALTIEDLKTDALQTLFRLEEMEYVVEVGLENMEEALDAGLAEMDAGLAEMEAIIAAADPNGAQVRADLANHVATKGAEMVKYNSVRTVKSKLDDVVNIKDFGAVCNNVANDYQALYDALNSGAKRVVIPSGTAYIGSTVAVPAGVTLEGNGATLRFPVGQHGIMMSGANARLQNITLDGTSVDEVNGKAGVVLYTDCTIENVTCNNWGWHGFMSADSGSHRNAIIGCSAYNCGHRGMNLSNGSTFNRVTNFQARNCKKAGIILGYRSNNNIFDTVYIDGHGDSVTGSAGLWVHMNCDYNIFRNFQIGQQNLAQQTNAPSVLLGAACQMNTFDGFILTDCWDRGLYIWNQNVDHPELGTVNAPINANRFSNFTIIGNEAPGLSAGILLNVDDARDINNNVFDGFYIDKFRDGVRDDGLLTNGTQFRNFRFGGLIPNLPINMGSNANSYRTTLRRNCGPLVTGLASLANTNTGYETHPALAANGVAVTQCYPFPVHIYVANMPSGGNVSVNGVLVNGNPVNNGNGMYTVYPGQTITLHYASGTPTWKWFGGDW